MPKIKYFIVLLAMPLVLSGCGTATQNPTAVAPSGNNQNQAVKPADNNQNANNSVSAKTYRVSINNFQFSPQILDVKVGDTIIWTNNDSVAHTVNSDPHPVHTDHPSLNLGPMQPGESVTFIADAPGKWGYHCHYHPSMTGTINIAQ
jgi:plastocyanin